MDENLQKQLLFEAQRKSTGASYLLWFFLGGLGAHRFYLGQTGTAITQLLLLLLGWIPIGLGWLVLGIWWIVDAFLIPGMVERENMETIQALGGFQQGGQQLDWDEQQPLREFQECEDLYGRDPRGRLR